MIRVIIIYFILFQLSPPIIAPPGCTSNSDCSDPNKPQCDGSACISCTSDSQCSSLTNTPKCQTLTGLCVECLDNSDCTTPAKTRCDSNICEVCQADAECSAQGYLSCESLGCTTCSINNDCTGKFQPERGICNTNRCVQCQQSDDCDLINPICNLATSTCELCQNDAECLGKTGFNKCDNGRCIQCQNQIDCPLNHICDNGMCYECLTSADCGNTKPICNQNKCEVCAQNSDCASASPNQPICFTDGKCVECGDNNNCQDPTKSKCSNNICGGCSIDNDCQHLTTTPKCNLPTNTCLQCLSSGDCSSDPSKPLCSSSNVCSSCSHSGQPDHLECKNKNLATPFCSGDACVECLADADCQSDPLKTLCRGNTCTQYNCLQNSHCQDLDSSFCELNTHECTGCKDNADCAHIESNSICDSQERKCISLQLELNVTDIKIRVKDIISFQLFFNSSLQGESNKGKIISKLKEVSNNQIKIQPKVSNNKVELPQLIDNEQNIYQISSLSKINSDYFSSFEVEFTIDNQITTLTKKVKVELLDQCWQDKHCQSTSGVCTEEYQCQIKEDSAMAAVNSVLTGVGATVLSSSGPMLLMGADPTLIYGLIHIMQIFYYLLFLNVKYPSNAQSFLNLFKMGRLEFLPNPFSGFGSNLEESQIESPPNFMENDFSGLFIQSAGGILFFIFLNTLIYLISKVLQKRFFPSKLRNLGAKVIKDFEWSGLLRVWTASYLELSIASTLQITLLNSETPMKTFSSIFGVGILLTNLALPILLFRMLKKVSDKRGLGKFASAFEDYILTDKFKKLFAVFSLSRKLLQALFIVLLYYAPILQLFTNWILGMVFLVALLDQRPHMKISQNFLEIFSELIFFILHSIILCLAIDDSADHFEESLRYTLGWIIVVSCVLLIVVYFGFLVSEQLIVIKLTIKKLLAMKLKKEVSKEQPKNILQQKSSNKSRRRIRKRGKTMSKDKKGLQQEGKQQQQQQDYQRETRKGANLQQNYMNIPSRKNRIVNRNKKGN